MEQLGLCKWCGCPMCRDVPLVEFEGVWCNHEMQTEMDEEVMPFEDSK